MTAFEVSVTGSMSGNLSMNDVLLEAIVSASFLREKLGILLEGL